MKPIKVGTYQLGTRTIRLYLRPGDSGGSVRFSPPDRGTTKVEVGSGTTWGECIGILFHELYEAVLIDLNARYAAAPTWAESSSSYLFVATHEQLDEAHMRVGECVTDMYDDLKKTAFDWSRQQRKKRLAKKKKKA